MYHRNDIMLCQEKIHYLWPGLPTMGSKYHQECYYQIFTSISYGLQVIAYSLYGNLSRPDMVERYVKPLAASAAAAGVWYPGWIVRIYHDAGADDDDGAALERRFGRLAHVDLCPVRRVLADRRLRDPFAMTWRFLPLLDPLVDRLMSRDADSPLLPREVDAVRQWIASNRTFHIMRDHVGHCVPMLGGDKNPNRFFISIHINSTGNVPIISWFPVCVSIFSWYRVDESWLQWFADNLQRLIWLGLWGVQLRNPQRSELELVARKMLTKYHRHEIGVDQSLLQRYIWPLAMKDSVILSILPFF